MKQKESQSGKHFNLKTQQPTKENIQPNKNKQINRNNIHILIRVGKNTKPFSKNMKDRITLQ